MVWLDHGSADPTMEKATIIDQEDEGVLDKHTSFVVEIADILLRVANYGVQ